MASKHSGGRVIQRIAFAGAGYVFHKLDKNSYEKEMERHNKAMEEFNKEKEKWYKRTVEKKQDSVTTTKTFGCEQGPRRTERSPSQPENGHRRP